MKYTKEQITVIAKEVNDEVLPGPGKLKKPFGLYDPIEIPDEAIGVHLSEEILVVISPAEQAKLTGIPDLDKGFIRKHTRGILRISYLLPVKAQLVK